MQEALSNPKFKNEPVKIRRRKPVAKPKQEKEFERPKPKQGVLTQTPWEVQHQDVIHAYMSKNYTAVSEELCEQYQV